MVLRLQMLLNYRLMKLTLGTFYPLIETLDNEYKSVHLLPQWLYHNIVKVKYLSLS